MCVPLLEVCIDRHSHQPYTVSRYCIVLVAMPINTYIGLASLYSADVLSVPVPVVEYEIRACSATGQVVYNQHHVLKRCNA